MAMPRTFIPDVVTPCSTAMTMGIIADASAVALVNAPQNMVAYGTETFQAPDFVRTGPVLTVIAFGLVILLGATYWRWLGYV
jgi:di/tricarboxylate transporter